LLTVLYANPHYLSVIYPLSLHDALPILTLFYCCVMLKRLGVLINSAEKYPSNLSSQYLRKEARIAKYLCSMQVFGLTVENLFFCKEEKMKDYLTSAQLEDYLDFFGEATDVVATIALYVTIAFFLFIAIYAVVIRNRD